MSVSAEEGVRERLLAYIHPRVPQTKAQEDALDDAVEVQVEYERANGMDSVPANVASVSNDGVSMTFRDSAGASGYTRETISPVAWSILRNAGLIAYALPTARRP